jgi:CRISPR-associated protein Cmr5
VQQQNGGNPGDEYVSIAKAAPSMIMSNGLMQTLAFYQAKGKPIRADITTWLGHRMGKELPAGNGKGADQNVAMGKGEDFRIVMSFLQNASSEQYMRATEEALTVLKWIRHFAAALKKGG